jgi:hypothetical protein
MAEKGAGRDLFHLVPHDDGEPAARPVRLGAKKPPLLGSRARAAKLWLGEVRVHRGPHESSPGGGA